MIITKDEKKYLVDEETGELVLSSTNKTQFDEVEHRAKSWFYLHMYRKYAYSKSLRLCHITSMTRAKSSLLTTSELSSSAKSLKTFKEPFSNSQTTLAHDSFSTGSYAYVLKNIETNKAHFGGVVKCSNPWSCPICSQKITQKRSSIVKEMTDKHAANGGFIYLVTLTAPHKKDKPLSEFVNQMTNCYRKLTNEKLYKQFKQDSVIGFIRAFEVTYGDANGWHPHFHILVFATHKLDYSFVQNLYLGYWKKHLTGSGFVLDEKNDGKLVDVRGGKDAGVYVVKMGDTNKQWQFSDEITKSNRKVAKLTKAGVRYTPFSLLKSWADSAYTKDAPVNHLRLFMDFEKAFSGKNQLVVSPGLYAHFEIHDKSDSLLNTEETEPAGQLASLSYEQWSIIAKNNLFSEVLTSAENGLLNQFLLNLEFFDAHPELKATELFKSVRTADFNDSIPSVRFDINYAAVSKNTNESLPLPLTNVGKRNISLFQKPKKANSLKNVIDKENRINKILSSFSTI